MAGAVKDVSHSAASVRGRGGEQDVCFGCALSRCAQAQVEVRFIVLHLRCSLVRPVPGGRSFPSGIFISGWQHSSRSCSRVWGLTVSNARPVRSWTVHPLAASSSQSRCRCPTARSGRRSRRHRGRARCRPAGSESRDEPRDRSAASEQPAADACGFEQHGGAVRESVADRRPAPDRGAVALAFSPRRGERPCGSCERDGFAAHDFAHDLGQFVWGH